jgi:transposase-like protein
MTVSLVARRHGVAPNQLFTWRRLVVEGAVTAAGSGEQRPRRTAISLAGVASQMRAVLSHDAVTIRHPSGLKAAEKINCHGRELS